MILPANPLLPQKPESQYDVLLNQQLSKHLRDIAKKTNQIAAGTFAGYDGAAVAAPTTGTYSQGDRVWNSNPTELGVAAAKYVTLGFICVAGGTPGTWVQMRTLTGN